MWNLREFEQWEVDLDVWCMNGWILYEFRILEGVQVIHELDYMTGAYSDVVPHSRFLD